MSHAWIARYRAKGALRDVGKALGLSEELVKILSAQVWGWSNEGIEPKHVEELNLNLGDRRLRLALDLARQLIGTPRHLSQHPGGFVLMRDRLDDLVPIEPAAMKDRQVIEWDKDDIDVLRIMKVDCLALPISSARKMASWSHSLQVTASDAHRAPLLRHRAERRRAAAGKGIAADSLRQFRNFRSA